MEVSKCGMTLSKQAFCIQTHNFYELGYKEFVLEMMGQHLFSIKTKLYAIWEIKLWKAASPLIHEFAEACDLDKKIVQRWICDKEKYKKQE